MLKRALPIVLAAAVIVPLVAQDRVVPYVYTRVGASHETQPARAAATAAYFPERFDWQHKKPEEVGMSTGAIADAVQLAIAADTPGTHDMALFLHNSFGKE
ncbi:MAG TPA: hypothetical protein VNG89_02310, partial [Vicinamibacterales bacterium]|nr:hypothetical protein [Vicinamibacterales bacterium]